MSKNTNKNKSYTWFSHVNYSIMLLAIMLIITGFVLMSGEASSSESFCPDNFSVRRIVIAPIVCFSGYLLMVVGIVWRCRKKVDSK